MPGGMPAKFGIGLIGGFGTDGRLTNPLNAKAKLFDPPNKYEIGTFGRFAIYPGRYEPEGPSIGGSIVDGGRASSIPCWNPCTSKSGSRMFGLGE